MLFPGLSNSSLLFLEAQIRRHRLGVRAGHHPRVILAMLTLDNGGEGQREGFLKGSDDLPKFSHFSLVGPESPV